MSKRDLEIQECNAYGGALARAFRKHTNGDVQCPKCDEIIRGAGGLVSVAVYLHNETPGECRPKLEAK